MKNINSVKTQIESLRSLVTQSLEQIDKQTIQRHRKLETAHVLYCLCLKVCHHIGYQDALSKMQREGFLNDLSYQSINNKIRNGTYDQHFNSLNQQLIQSFFTPENKDIPRKVAVDGSHIPLPISLKHRGYLRISKDPYTTGLISTIYDLENQIPLSYCLNKSLNERDVFYQQFSKIDQPMIFIGDRGYFSRDLILKILRVHKHFILRLPVKSHWIQQLRDSNKDDIITTLEQFQVRLIHYQIPSRKIQFIRQEGSPLLKPVPFKKDYYLITSLVDSIQYPTTQLIQCYHQRWEIEEYYKTIKNRLATGTFLSKIEAGILCEITVQQMLSIFNRFFSNLLNHDTHRKLNHTLLMKRVVDQILPSILFDKPYKTTTKDIIECLEILEKYQIPIRNGRSFPREQRFHSNKFPTKKIPTDY